LVGDYLLPRDFGHNGILFKNVCVVITVAMVMLLREEDRLRVFENRLLRKIFGPKRD
jgi:hypothetical protein